MFLITLAFAGAAGLCLAAPEMVRSLVLLPFPLTAAAGISGAIALAACITGILKLGKNRRFRKELDTSTRLLQEIFARHLGDSSISQDAMNALEGRMAEFLRLSKAVEQSEQTLVQLSPGDWKAPVQRGPVFRGDRTAAAYPVGAGTEAGTSG